MGSAMQETNLTDASTPGTFELNNNREDNAGFLQAERRQIL